MVFLITYDLKTPNDTPDDYLRVINCIKEFKTWCHIEESVWLIETALNAGEIRDYVRRFISADSVLFVARLQGNWASWALCSERNDWLKVRTF